jgi:AraC-like DNA-binding protein
MSFQSTNTVLPLQADITSEQLILSPEKDGLEGIPAISFAQYSTNWQALPEHVHDGCIEICFCARGSLVFECEGVAHTILPNNVFLTQPDDRHHLVTNHKGMRIYWLFFKYPLKGHSVLGLSKKESDELVKQLTAIHAHVFAVDPTVHQLFKDFFRASQELPAGAYRTLMLRTIVLRLLLVIAESAGNRPTLKTLAKISSIAALIRKRPSHRFSTAELAAHAKLSESHFTSLFRQVIGLPPYAYLTKCRLEAAQKLLSETDIEIKSIAKSLGFASPQHLAAQFRKTYGATASEWRAMHKSTGNYNRAKG